MINKQPNDRMPSGYDDERPFCMSDLTRESANSEAERSYQPHLDTANSVDFSLQRNRFFGGVCLALPLSALFWIALFYFLP